MNINSFSAVRPIPEKVSAVAAVPYDVVDTAEARVLAAGNPDSFLHVSRPEIDMPDGTDCSSPEAYKQAKNTFEDMVDRGTLVDDDEYIFYAYRLTMGDHVQTGLVATFDARDYINGDIKQHEKTRKDKEEDRMRHIETLQAQTGPVYLTYKDNPDIDELIAKACKEEKPFYDFVADDGIRHTVWRLGGKYDGIGSMLCDFFHSYVPALYIADGHHRSAAAARVAEKMNFNGEYRWILGVAFPASQLKVLPYNRLISDLNGLTAAELLAKAREVFTVTEVADGTPTAGRHARMFLDGKWYDLAWEVLEGTDVVSSLDVSVLQNRFLAPVLGIDDPRTSPRISFMGGIRSLDELSGRVTSGRDAVAFSMFPVTVQEMMDIADAGAIMPPKSTWFEPKLRSGLFTHRVRLADFLH